jgi:DNA (cytosine-5)-methyltransferase 1
MLFPQMLLGLHDELIVDLFAGGGGASCGIEMATGRNVDIAINHDPAAVAMHRINHPQTDHHVCDVFEADPRQVTGGRPIGLLWASPDCTFHSKARGAKPIRSKERKRRALAWVVTRWAGQVRPRVIMLENVEEFADWGPLVGPAHAQRPCPKRRGRTFRKWVRSLERLGYQVEWRELRACDYGAPTIRKRLFVIARCDGEPIVWPEPTHGEGKSLKPYRTAAECIDWSIPMLSIFATREEAREWARAHGVGTPVRPLAEATMRRIARGVMRYVVENPEPYIIGVGGRAGQSPERSLRVPMQTVTAKGDAAIVVPHVTKFRGGATGHLIDEPLHTVTANSFEKRPGGSTPLGLVAPYLIPRYGERAGQEPRTRSVEEPSPVVVPSGNGASLCAAFLAQNNAGFYDGDGRTMTEPNGTVLASGSHHSLVAAHLSHFYTSNTRGGEGDPGQPMKTHVTANHAAVVYAFLQSYYGAHQAGDPSDPLATVTTKDRHSVVTVEVAGEPYVIADIAMRMLQPRELYNAQGFPPEYVIDRGADGRKLTKTEQVRMCGNSVCPPVAAALARANVPELRSRDEVAA